jgi:hypothetical protein
LSDPIPTTINTVFNKRQVFISPAYLIHVEGNDAVNQANEGYAYFFQDFIQPGEVAMEPVSDIYYPILANAADDVSTQGTDGDVVAILSLSVYWRNTLKNILPTGANGVDVEFTNPCSPTFTYRVNGPAVEYRGAGDLHETAYTNLGTSAKLLDLQDHGIANGRAYTGIPISQDNCPFTLTVYPSAALHDYYTTNNPMLFTIAAVIIFLFTSAVFVLYDIMVERRQKLVLSTAAKTSAIVSSLFPSNVRAELMKEQDEKERERERERRERAAIVESPKQSPKRRLKTLLMDADANNGQGLVVSPPTLHSYASKPLADLYADTTVFFGDIAGFTAWSKYFFLCWWTAHQWRTLSWLMFYFLFGKSKARLVILHRSLLFSKPCMELLMPSHEGEGSSRLKPLVTHMLQYVDCQSLAKSMLSSWPSLPQIVEARRIRFVKNLNCHLGQELLI